MNDLSWRSGPARAPTDDPVLIVGRSSFFDELSRVLPDAPALARWARDEAAARRILARTSPALLILDGGLATPTDFSLCARLADSAMCPVLMVAATDDEVDRILALKLGAADCVSAACTPRELLARVQARLRPRTLGPRSWQTGPGMLAAFGDWRLDTVASRVLCPDGRWVRLGFVEAAILRLLTAHAGRLVPFSEISGACSSGSRGLTDNHLRVQISRLRRKLGDDSCGRGPIWCAPRKGYGVPAAPEDACAVPERAESAAGPSGAGAGHLLSGQPDP